MVADAEPTIGTGVSNEAAAMPPSCSAGEMVKLAVLVAAGAAVAGSLYALHKATTLPGELARGAKRVGELLERDDVIEQQGEQADNKTTTTRRIGLIGEGMLSLGLSAYGNYMERDKAAAIKQKPTKRRLATIGSAVTPFAGVMSND